MTRTFAIIGLLAGLDSGGSGATLRPIELGATLAAHRFAGELAPGARLLLPGVSATKYSCCP